ncbi:MAG: flagellar export chaperone FliS [Proteobacteria bacterium]|nr:flagellar export chaperone FliS [Pseudomonadota bacterium]
MSFALSQYRTANVQTASPVQIVVKLYDGAIRFMRQAEQAIRGDDMATKGVALGRAHAIVSELQATLATDKAPELCESLERLYEFVLFRITQCNATSDVTQLGPAISVMGELRHAWAELASQGAK